MLILPFFIFPFCAWISCGFLFLAILWNNNKTKNIPWWLTLLIDVLVTRIRLGCSNNNNSNQPEYETPASAATADDGAEFRITVA